MTTAAFAPLGLRSAYCMRRGLLTTWRTKYRSGSCKKDSARRRMKMEVNLLYLEHYNLNTVSYLDLWENLPK